MGTIFSLSNLLVMPLWLLMIFLPRWRLTARLVRSLLEEHGVVTRRFYSNHPPRAAYVLTAKGRELGVVIGALASWGARHAGSPFTPIYVVRGQPAEVVYRCPRFAELLSWEDIEPRHADTTTQPAGAPPIVESSPAPGASSE
jgi:hypothetical protein